MSTTKTKFVFITNNVSAATPDYTIANGDVVSKYKTAGEIARRVLSEVIKQVIEGSSTFEISKKGDELLEEELSKVYNSKKTSKISKGISFPTCVNPNNIPAHLAPISEDDDSNIVLKKGDVVNVMLGAHIDGYPSVVAETVVVGASEAEPVTGKKADLLYAAWNASEAAIRTFRPNNKNWDVTNIIQKVAKYYDTTPVESMLSHNQEKNVLYGPKEIILNPAKENKSQMDTYKFEENEVYGLDVLISTSSDGKVKRSDYRTSLYKLTGNSYALKMKLSHQVLGEFKKKCSGPFPYNVRNFEDPRKARAGLIECSNHNVILPYDIVTEKEGEYIAQFFTTFGVTKNGIVKYTSPSFDQKLYKTEKKIEDEDIAQLISSPLKVASKKKNKKSSATASQTA
ncbi:uncharacterized protein PRCAT00001729001 [Priceomyces carsonii]|uniref:uncharacterized protein n=1 Tax=Priceomyces carsonii TaxID=28549 RepID=UPI002EDA532B|nr:unnamed protein product [Priceomyces carsonii]